MASVDISIQNAIASSELASALLGKRNAEKEIKMLCRSIDPKSDVIDVLAQLTPDQRAKMSEKVRALNPQYNATKYTACLQEIANYRNEVDIKLAGTTRYLTSNKLEFNVDIPIDDERLYIGDQYFKTQLVMDAIPQSTINAWIASPPNGLAIFDPTKIRYRWTQKPGIRFIQEVTFNSDVSGLYTFKQNTILLKDKEFIPHHSKKLWNSLIGHDMGEKSEVVLPDTDAVEIRRIKLGAQTPKASAEPLNMFIPLWYDFNTDPALKLNTGTFRQKSLSFSGLLAPAQYMAIAEYHDGTTQPFFLVTPKVKVQKFSLIGCYTRLSEYLHALNIYQPWSRLVSIIKEERHVALDLDEPITVDSKSLAEVLSVVIRPVEYETDFDRWTDFCVSQRVIVQVPIIINNLVGVPQQAAVGAATCYIPVSIIDEIGVRHDEIDLKETIDPFFYSTLASYKDGFKNTQYMPDVYTGVHHFKFNESFPRKQFSSLINFASLAKPEVVFKFKPGMISIENILSQPWETLFFIHTINVFKSHGRSMGLSYAH
jgi:hypothetical protein